MEMGGKRSAEDRLIARSRFIYTLKEVALRISENLELIDEVTANSDNMLRANSFMSMMAAKRVQKA